MSSTKILGVCFIRKIYLESNWSWKHTMIIALPPEKMAKCSIWWRDYLQLFPKYKELSWLYVNYTVQHH